MPLDIYHPVGVHEEEAGLVRHLLVTLMGGLLIVNAFIAARMFPDIPQLSGLSALAGALLLGVPMIIGAMKGFLRVNSNLPNLPVLQCLPVFLSVITALPE